MGELTIRSARAQRNLMEWSQRVSECRNSGLSVTRWCAEHDVKVKTYYNWQKKVFAAMIEQQKELLETPVEESRFVELPVPMAQRDLVASVRIGTASLDVYSGASAEIAAALCKALTDAE